jgi:hypothetical protein
VGPAKEVAYDYDLTVREIEAIRKAAPLPDHRIPQFQPPLDIGGCAGPTSNSPGSLHPRDVAT